MREVVHFQRFGEALRIVQDRLNAKNFYALTGVKTAMAVITNLIMFTYIRFISKPTRGNENFAPLVVISCPFGFVSERTES